MELFEKTLTTDIIFTGRVFTVRKDTVRLPNEREVPRELVLHSGGASVLALTDDMKIPMVRQYRYGAGRVLLELPAGKIEQGEDPMSCGVRELREECGYTAERVDSLGSIIPTAAYCSEVIYLYLARGLKSVQSCLDDDEFLEPELIPFDEALNRAADGRISDAKTVAALFRAQRLLEN